MLITFQHPSVAFLKGIIGLRKENHSTSGSQYLPLYGLILNPFAETAIKVSSGKHFKAPTPNDLFWPEDNFVRGNPDLKPQTGWHSDITIEQALWQNKLFLEFSYFDWNIDGKIDWAENPAYPGPWGNKWTPTNLNKSNGQGFESGITISPTSQLLIKLDYTYTEAEEEVGNITRNAQYVPTHKVKGTFTNRLSNNTSATAIVNYVSERSFYRSTADLLPTDELESYFLADIKIMHFFTENCEASLTVNNIFDADYDTYIGSFTDKGGNRIYGGYPGAGRTAFAKLTYTY